jgi:hypothetical protein
VPRNADGSVEKAHWAAAAWTPVEPLRALPVPFADRLAVALPEGGGARELDAAGTERWASAPGSARTLDLGTAEWPAGRYWLCPFARTGEPCTPLVKAR